MKIFLALIFFLGCFAAGLVLALLVVLAAEGHPWGLLAAIAGAGIGVVYACVAKRLVRRMRNGKR